MKRDILVIVIQSPYIYNVKIVNLWRFVVVDLVLFNPYLVDCRSRLAIYNALLEP